MTTFTAPLQVGTKRHEPGKNLGQAVLTQTNTVAFSDTTKTMFVLPAQSQIIEMYVDITTVFNAAVTNTLDVGTAADPDAFVDAQDLTTAGRFRGSTSAQANLSAFADVGSSDVTVQAVYNQGAGPTTGAARVTVVYAVNKVLPA
jgi:hypothetical protein